LKNGVAPLSYMIASRNGKRSPLYHFDGKTNRALRYARNQQSPFEDEQDGNAILEPITFIDGALHVPKNNPVLQKFLDIHPGNGHIFEEVNTEKDAYSEVEKLNYSLDAQLAARDLPLELLESVSRVLLGSKIDKMTTAELKRDVLVYAKNHPVSFLEMLNDPMLELQNKCAKFFEQGLLVMKNKNKDVYFNLPQNKKKLLTVPYGEDYIYIVASFMQSDEGLEVLRLLDNKMS
jgi:hypothetical protein